MNTSTQTIGIVAEYNPFHLGHKKQLHKLREQFSHATIIAVMSASFVQRGEPAMFTKYDRARWALANGCDVVFELPTVYSVSSAEGFASGAMRLLHSIGVPSFSFGSEITDITVLSLAVQTLLDSTVQLRCRELLQEGLFYGTALRTAVAEVNPSAAEVLNLPNALLGIEYMKASETYGLNLQPFPIQRNSSHHSNSLPNTKLPLLSEEINTNVQTLPSGKALRGLLRNWPHLPVAEKEAVISTLKNLLPSASFSSVEIPKISDVPSLMTLGNYCEYTRYEEALLIMSRLTSADALATIAGFSEGLQFAWKKASALSTWAEAREQIKSNRYSYSRIDRMGASFLLNLTDILRQEALKQGPPYARLLGFTTNGQHWLSETESSIPIVNKWGSYCRNAEGFIKQLTELDNRATDIQSFAMSSPKYRLGNLDYTSSPIRETTPTQ